MSILRKAGFPRSRVIRGFGLGQAPPGTVVYPTDKRPVTKQQCTDGGGDLYYNGTNCCIDLGDGRFSCVPIAGATGPAYPVPPTSSTPNSPIGPLAPGFSSIPPGLPGGPSTIPPGLPGGPLLPGMQRPGTYPSGTMQSSIGMGTIAAIAVGVVGIAYLLKRRKTTPVAVPTPAAAPLAASERVSNEPYNRAIDRIEALIDRGEDARAGTHRRINATSDPGKLHGIYHAAKKYGWSDVANAAKKKYKNIVGRDVPVLK